MISLTMLILGDSTSFSQLAWASNTSSVGVIATGGLIISCIISTGGLAGSFFISTSLTTSLESSIILSTSVCIIDWVIGLSGSGRGGGGGIVLIYSWFGLPSLIGGIYGISPPDVLIGVWTGDVVLPRTGNSVAGINGDCDPTALPTETWAFSKGVCAWVAICRALLIPLLLFVLRAAII